MAKGITVNFTYDDRASGQIFRLVSWLWFRFKDVRGKPPPPDVQRELAELLPPGSMGTLDARPLIIEKLKERLKR